MNLHSKRLHGNLIYYDTYTHRWIDAVGLGVVKVTMADALNVGAWTQTAVSAGTGTSVIQGAGNGKILTYAATNENDGIQMQHKLESFNLTADDPLYFGCKFQISEKTQSDACLGLCITDTSLCGGMTDGVFFRTVDASAVMNFVSEKDSTETETAAMTLVDATDYWAEFVWDGTDLKAYIDGAIVATHTTHIPDNEELTASVAYLNGAGSMLGDGLTITNLTVIQINSDRT